MRAKLDYIELPVSAVGPEMAFYASAFGWSFTEYGPQYASHEEQETQLALNGTEEPSESILPLIRVDDAAAAREAVLAAGGSITKEITAYPGGKRFLFRDPAGHELGCYEVEEG